jgi:hypothetical protein
MEKEALHSLRSQRGSLLPSINGGNERRQNTPMPGLDKSLNGTSHSLPNSPRKSNESDSGSNEENESLPPLDKRRTAHEQRKIIANRLFIIARLFLL